MTEGTGVAVAGCGYWGANLVRVFNELGALRLVCDPVQANRERARAIGVRRQPAETMEPACVRIWILSVLPTSVGVIDLDQRVRHRHTFAVQHTNPQLNVSAGGIWCRDPSEPWIGCEAEVKERAHRLR